MADPQAPTPPTSHGGCRAYAKAVMAHLGTDVTVSTEPPLVQGAYENAGFRCPHGTVYWVAPTGEQIAQWAKDDVR